MSDPEGLIKAEVIRSLGYDPWRAYAIPPTPVRSIYLWLLKVGIPLQRGAIFQHKSHAILTYLQDALQIASKMQLNPNLAEDGQEDEVKLT